MPLLRLFLVGLVAVLLGAAATGLAQGPFGIGTITDNLAATGVAIDPEAEVPVAQARRFERAVEGLRTQGVPADVVVLRRQALGASTFAEELHRERGYDGIQVVIVQEPRSISFAAPGVYDFQAEHQQLVERAGAALPRDPVAAVETLARRGWAYAQAEESASGSGDSDEGGVAETIGRIIGVLIVLGLVVGLVLLGRRFRLRRQQPGVVTSWGVSFGRSAPEAVSPHEALDGLLDDLARRITELAPEVDRPEAPEEARRAYAEAVLAYGEARDALPKATTTRRARAVHNDIARGLNAAEAAQAIMDGDRPGDNGRRTRRR